VTQIITTSKYFIHSNDHIKGYRPGKGGALYVGKTGPVMRIPLKLVHIEMIMWTPRVYLTANLDHLPGT